MKDYSLREKINFSGTPDEDGDFMVSARSSTVFMTRKEMRELRDHLDAALNIDQRVGKLMRVRVTSHKDLRGEIGRVATVTPSGNLELRMLGSGESLIVDPNSVEPA